MRTTRQQQRAEARVWRELAEGMAVESADRGLCYALDGMDVTHATMRRVAGVIRTSVWDEYSFGAWPYLSDTTFGPDWDRCLFACLMAAVAEAGDMDVYRWED